MERKLLSLPSFFVLLLIAGIAFLAAPVVDVHAVTLPATGVTVKEDGSNVVYTFAFDGAIAGITNPTGTPAILATAGFGPEDLVITRAYSKPTVVAAVTLDRAGEFTIAALPAITAGTNARAANQHFTVTVPKALANSDGTIVLKLAASPEIEDTAQTPQDVTLTAQTAIQNANAGLSQAWTDYDGDAPTVTFANTGAGTGPGLGTTGFALAVAAAVGPPAVAAKDAVYQVTGGTGNADIFQVKIEFNEALGTGDAAFTAADVTLATMPAPKVAAGATAPPDASRVEGLWAAADSTPTAPKYIVVINPVDGATSVEIKVNKDAVADATGNKSVETKATATINRRPTVEIKLTPTGTPPAAPTQPFPADTMEFGVTFELSAVPGTGTDEDLQPKDITVTNGTVKDDSLRRILNVEPTDTVKASYTAMITLPEASARKSPVTITVVEDAIKSGVLGNVASTPVNIMVTVPTTPTTPTTAPTGTTGDPLTGDKVGFTFALPSVPADGFVVLAKNPASAGFTAAVSPIDIIDTKKVNNVDVAVWQDLRHFLVTREGGTIDLIGPTGSAVKSLVISEVMWGNDAGLGQGLESNSQWIELYNTTNAVIPAGTWELEFTAKSRGGPMPTGDDAKVTTTNELGGVTTPTVRVVDKLSTWRDVGTYWDWRITDSAGGSHGQSGKSTPNSATSVGNQVELVSMQRNINYDNVVKTHDADDGVKNRTEQLKAVPGGVAADNWEATQEHGALLRWRKGTPGAKPTIKKVDQSGIARGSVVFNEIANRSDKKHDWIELYNKSGSAQKINGWELSVVSVVDGTRDDRELFTFTSDDDINVPAKGYLLVVNTDPRHTTLEGGYDVANPGNSARQSDGVGTNKPSRLYYVSEKLDIPEKDFLLILRKGNDKTGTHEKVEDVAGHNPRFDDNAKSTQVWPLNSWSVGALDDLGQKNDKTWVRDQGKAVFHGDAWKSDGGFTGVGIDRNAGTGNYTSGTPGYANNAVQTEVKSDGLTNANPVIISEIMFATDGRSPQWIELHNPSHTQAVNLKGWKLEIFNYYGDETLEVNHYAELKSLPEVRIQPNQTILIVSRATSRTSDSDAFPSNRIIDVWANTELRDALDMQNQRDAILSATGFHLKLSDPRKTVVDEVGNIDTNRRTNDEPDWELPGGSIENGRSAMVRDLEGSAGNGTQADAWRDANLVDSSKIQPDATELYYGDEDDVGTPGYTPGGVLPVQLSSFYSKRNDAGAVIITWSTESELDNAGFNILRSQSRTGEFTRINAQLIPGAGTTGEKTAYTWTDTSAKPNVLYFYQIEDVSLAGEHQTLRTTRLRGYVGAAGKATTTWGDLKSRE